MKCFRLLFLATLATIIAASPLRAADDNGREGTIFTFWPLIDYRESPAEEFSNLSILGPLVKIQRQGDETVTALRPLVYRTSVERDDAAGTSILYPLASVTSVPEQWNLQVLQLLQVNAFRRDEPGETEDTSMLFPLYIRGESREHGTYTSVFPFYGTLYNRLFRDEIHYVLFPLYGRTVAKGTTTRHYLYPFFATIEGQEESGWQFWPLYGRSSGEGRYDKQFVLWPLYLRERAGLDTDNPTERLTMFPFYASTESPRLSSRSYLWPFAGWSSDHATGQEERYYLWPFIMTARGEKREVDRFLPFYSREQTRESVKQWYLWPLVNHDEITSDTYCRDRDRLLFFLYSDSIERWPIDGAERRTTALWPLFTFHRNERGVKSFSFPAPLEPLTPREGIEQNWAPLWRLYIQKWNDGGDSAVSFLWNLYWHEKRGNDLAYEVFPLLAYRTRGEGSDVSILKGLVRYRSSGDKRMLRLFWLPFGLEWTEGSHEARGATPPGETRIEARYEP